ncbi:MAG: hypothetical protein AB1778_00925 [Candidatus Bipolaricaulota bacterium]
MRSQDTGRSLLRRLLVFLALGALGASVLAVETSVDVKVRWRVLPYQSLSVVGSASAGSTIELALPQESPLGSGQDETPRALRLLVASNVPWKVQIRLEGEGISSAAYVEARQTGGTYVFLSGDPVIVARGAHGVYDVDLDIRWTIGGPSAREVLQRTRLIATILPD